MLMLLLLGGAAFAAYKATQDDSVKSASAPTPKGTESIVGACGCNTGCSGCQSSGCQEFGGCGSRTPLPRPPTTATEPDPWSFSYDVPTQAPSTPEGSWSFSYDEPTYSEPAAPETPSASYDDSQWSVSYDEPTQAPSYSTSISDVEQQPYTGSRRLALSR